MTSSDIERLFSEPKGGNSPFEVSISDATCRECGAPAWFRVEEVLRPLFVVNVECSKCNWKKSAVINEQEFQVTRMHCERCRQPVWIIVEPAVGPLVLIRAKCRRCDTEMERPAIRDHRPKFDEFSFDWK